MHVMTSESSLCDKGRCWALCTFDWRQPLQGALSTETLDITGQFGPALQSSEDFFLLWSQSLSLCNFHLLPLFQEINTLLATRFPVKASINNSKGNGKCKKIFKENLQKSYKLKRKKRKTCKVRVKNLGICTYYRKGWNWVCLIRYFREDDVHLFLLRKESELP